MFQNMVTPVQGSGSGGTQITSVTGTVVSTSLSGTDKSLTVLSYSVAENINCVSGTLTTNTGSNHGYVKIQKNGTDIMTETLTTNATVSFGTAVTASVGDTITCVIGFTSNHTSNFTGAITILNIE